MSTKQVPPELMDRFRKTHAELKPLLDEEMKHVRAHWDELLEGVPDIVQQHEDEFEAYIAKHGPMTRRDVIERALEKLFSEV